MIEINKSDTPTLSQMKDIVRSEVSMNNLERQFAERLEDFIPYRIKPTKKVVRQAQPIGYTAFYVLRV